MRLKALILALAIGAPVLAAAPNAINRASYEAGTILLWGGDDLSGWQAPGGNWAAEDGAIVRTGLGGDIWLRNARLPGAIDLRFEYRAGSDASGGVATHAASRLFAIGRHGDGQPDGCQPAPAGDGRWHQARIRAADGEIEHWVDGRLSCRFAAADASDPATPDFFLRLVDGAGAIAFRNLTADPMYSPGQFRLSPLAGLQTKVAFGEAMAAYAARLPAAPLKGIGYPPPLPAPRGALALDLLGTDADGSWYRYSVPALAGLAGGGIIGVPKARSGKLPVMIAIHGTGGSPELAMNPAGLYHDLVRGPLRDGYLIIAPQLYTFNRREAAFGNTLQLAVVEPVEKRLEAAGTSVYAVDTARIIAALDGVIARFPVDTGRIGVSGLSHGGFMASFVAAADGRIAAGAGTGGFAPLVTPDDVPAPTLLLQRIAPRPFLLMAGTHDPINFVSAGWIDDYLPYVQSLYGGKGRLDVVADPAGHEFSWHIARKFFAETMPASK